jgi:hypothetical protein
MKAFLLAVCATVVITVGMNILLNPIGFSAEKATTGANTRVGASD